jgi:glycosyltransferase involved in cell wall biosynthesis
VTLLQAFASARRQVSGAHLHLVGDGDRRPALEKLAAQLGVESAITFHGAIPHHRLPGYFRAADVCVLSSRFEGQSMVVLEAAACGRLTIGSGVGILPEITDPSSTVPPGDATALSELLLAKLGASRGLPLRAQISPDSLAEAYGLHSTVGRLSDLYRSLRG